MAEETERVEALTQEISEVTRTVAEYNEADDRATLDVDALAKHHKLSRADVVRTPIDSMVVAPSDGEVTLTRRPVEVTPPDVSLPVGYLLDDELAAQDGTVLSAPYDPSVAQERQDLMLSAALDYRARRWSVIPLQPRDKRPLVTWASYQQRRATEQEINRWWRETPDANVGVVTGTVSGLIALDCDGAEGERALADRPMPPTPTAKTGKGQHYYFRHPGGDVRNFARKLPGLDLRGDGGQVVAPPSVHPSGAIYEWLISPDDCPLADAPEWLLDLIHGEPEKSAPSPKLGSATHPDVYVQAALRGEAEKLAAAVEGTRNDQLNRSAFALGQLAADLDQVIAWQALRDACAVNGLLSDDGERAVEQTFQSGWAAGLAEPRQRPEVPITVNSGTSHQDHKGVENLPERRFDLSQLGNAERFAAYHGDGLRYCYPLGRWFVWDGRRWAADTIGMVTKLAKATVRKMQRLAAALEDDTQSAALGKWAAKCRTRHQVEAMIALAQSEPGIPVTPDELDADPWALNTLTGTIDLRTGKLKPHDPDDLITRLAPVEYDPDAKLKLWDDFLDTATDGDGNLGEFLQQMAGYSATGSTAEERLVFVHGPTATDKSTFTEALRGALGDYATIADFESFLARRWSSGIRNDLARLRGARLVVSTEIERGQRLAEGLVKLITGGDTITARPLYRPEIEYLPAFTLWLVSNDPPRMRDDDTAIWRRVLKVPFDAAIPPERQNPEVKARLRDPTIGGPAVLAWIVKGAVAWHESGLTVPTVVKTATADLRASMDPLADFFEDRCAFGPDLSVSSSDLWTSHQEWGKGEYTVKRREFNERLRKHGCKPGRAHGGVRMWTGVGLTAQERLWENEP